VGPWRLVFAVNKCQWLAGGDALTAKGTFTNLEIYRRETAIAADKDSFRTGTETFVAARADFRKIRFGERPRRPYFCLGACTAAEKSPSAGVNHGLLAGFHFIDASTQHLIDFRTWLNFWQ
jgi:hypothetical protein